MLKTVLSSILVFLGNLLAQTIVVLMIGSYHGEIITSDAIRLSSGEFSQTVLIKSLSKNTTNGFEFEIKNGNLKSVIHNDYLEIDTSMANFIKINKIYPRRNYSVLFTFEGMEDQIPEIVPLNHSDLRYNYLLASQFDKSNRRFLWQVLITSFLLTVAYFLFALYIKREMTEERERYTKEETSISKRLEETVADLKKVTKRANQLRDSLLRQRILSNRQLKDYSTENQFYREIISKILVTNKIENLDEKQLITIITENLKTYSTRINLNEIDTVDVIASMLKDKKV